MRDGRRSDKRILTAQSAAYGAISTFSLLVCTAHTHTLSARWRLAMTTMTMYEPRVGASKNETRKASLICFHIINTAPECNVCWHFEAQFTKNAINLRHIKQILHFRCGNSSISLCTQSTHRSLFLSLTHTRAHPPSFLVPLPLCSFRHTIVQHVFLGTM